MAKKRKEYQRPTEHAGKCQFCESQRTWKYINSLAYHCESCGKVSFVNDHEYERVNGVRE